MNGKKYAYNHDASAETDFENSVYSGPVVVQDGTPKLTQTLIETIKAKTK